MLAAPVLRINLLITVKEEDRARGAGARRGPQLLVGRGPDDFGDVAGQCEDAGRRVDAIAVRQSRAFVDLDGEGHAAS